MSRIKSGVDWRKANRSVFPTGSYGNGAAMRSGPLGLFYSNSEEDLIKNTRIAASITHAHPLGIEGAVLIAFSIKLALDGITDPKIFLKALKKKCNQQEYIKKIDSALSFQKNGSSGFRVGEFQRMIQLNLITITN